MKIKQLFKIWLLVSAFFVVFLVIISAIVGGGEEGSETKTSTPPPATTTSQADIQEVKELTPEEIAQKEKEDAERKAKAEAERKARAEERKEQVYLQENAEIANTVSSALTSMGTIVAKYPFISEDEKLVLVVSMATIQSGYTEAQKLTPTAKYEEVHKLVLIAYKNFSNAMDNLANGLDTSDVTLINKATQQISTGDTYIKEATAILNRVKNQ